ncbi:hypothetical protein KEM60_00544 [Austwickia sp. TVS 96-490-7B]|uniref:N-acetylglucosamine kinase n=1 Tax=Austwickia sp. TVS 96-490-7B TaxID=2830843 RepID=UPI001C5916DC|nr:BadF/BadG/BcrA/BcrD ATPase family protein [Austwickia sp. TVS 96-490-7B]MBW3084357.1 hypothetical protein [Austwickia sp. TVS 96-490-7B]
MSDRHGPGDVAAVTFFGVDIGGTATRAVWCDQTGHVLGVGVAAGGNPRSSPGEVSTCLTAAISRAHAMSGIDLTGSDSAQGRHAREAAPMMVGVGASGAGSARRVDIERSVHAGIAAAGLTAPVTLATDVDIAFRAGSSLLDGTVLIAGTGAVAATYRRGRLIHRRDGLGWLLGDTGSGTWIGRRVLRAVAAHVDGAGPVTLLTARVTADLGISPDCSPQDVIRACDELRPAEWARFAHVAVQLSDVDPVAETIVADAGAALISTLAAARGSATGPVVLAGGLLADGPVRHRIVAAFPEAVYVNHPVVGACLLAAESAGYDAIDRTSLAAELRQKIQLAA